MSTIRVFGWDGVLLGEVQGICSRGWAVNAGGQSRVALTQEAAKAPWLQFGGIAVIEHEKLPIWAGVIDTPMAMVPAPIQMTIYDIPYLLKNRVYETLYSVYVNGAPDVVFQWLLDGANATKETLIRMGSMVLGTTTIGQTVESKSFWDIMVSFARLADAEIYITPKVEGNRFSATMDVKLPVMSDPTYSLKDGDKGNMQITQASVDGVIYNRVTGMSDQSTGASRLKSGPVEDAVSIQKYGTRNTIVVFSGVTGQSALDDMTAAYLKQAAWPKLKLTVNVRDVEDELGGSFAHMRIGEVMSIHSCRLQLPGGHIGWRGLARITAMDYDESKNLMNLTMEGNL